MSERNDGLLKGLVIGGLIGVGLGILYAPKSGKETREDIARKTDDLLGKSREEYEKIVEKSKIAYELAVKRLEELELSARGKVEDAENKVNEVAQQSSGTIQTNKNKLKKAIDAGVQAYRHEKSRKRV